MKSYSLKLDNACQENWNEMRPCQGGNYCKLCAKTVIDFTGLTQPEILEKMKSSNGNICARVTKSQLDTPIMDTEKEYSFHFPYSKVAASLLIAASISAVQAGTVHKSDLKIETIYDPSSSTKSDPANDGYTGSSTKITPSNVTDFRGSIVSEKTGLPIENAKVTFFSLKKIFTTYTQADGSFLLRIPSYLIDNDNVIRVSYSDIVVPENQREVDFNNYYETDDLILTEDQITNHFIFKAAPDYIMLGGIGLYVDKEAQSPIVLDNGVEIKYKVFNKALGGDKSSCNMENKTYYYFNSSFAIALYGPKAKYGLYLIIDED